MGVLGDSFSPRWRWTRYAEGGAPFAERGRASGEGAEFKSKTLLLASLIIDLQFSSKNMIVGPNGGRKRVPALSRFSRTPPNKCLHSPFAFSLSLGVLACGLLLGTGCL